MNIGMLIFVGVWMLVAYYIARKDGFRFYIIMVGIALMCCAAINADARHIAGVGALLFILMLIMIPIEPDIGWLNWFKRGLRA